MENTQKRPCGLCGGVGNSQLMVTCSRCQETCQHLYCFPVVLMESPNNWLCEECQSIKESCQMDQGNQDVGNVPAATQSDLVNQSGRNDINGTSRAVSDRRILKPVRGGKVRYLPPEEAIALASGANRNPVHRQNRPSSSRKSPPSIQQHIGERNLDSIFLKPPGRNSVSIPSISSGQVDRQHKEQRAAPVLELHSIRMQTASINLANQIRVHKADVSKEATSSKYILPKLQVQPKMEGFGKWQQVASNNPGEAETHGDNVPEEALNLLNVECKVGIPKTSVPIEEARDAKTTLPKFDLYLQHFPALVTTWKGSIECSDAMGPVRWFEGFQVFPPKKIHRKAYEFSKMMPPVLQAKLLPLHQVLAVLFQSEYPNFQDIGLYFFPAADITRSEENYISLFKLLEYHSSVIRACVSNAELLIFTSKQLDGDSHATIDRFHAEFLWGVFHPTIAAHLSSMTCKKFSAPISAFEPKYPDNAGLHFSETINMEISCDDIVVDEQSSKSVPEDNSRNMEPQSNSLKALEIIDPDIKELVLQSKEAQQKRSHIIASIAEKIRSNMDFSSPSESSNVKFDSDFRPGFEEMAKLKLTKAKHLKTH